MPERMLWIHLLCIIWPEYAVECKTWTYMHTDN